MTMASKEGQGQASPQSAENYWLQCIKAWYPKLHTQTYFLPPLHFNRVPYSVENIAGEQVLVPQIPQDGPGHTSSTVKSKSQDGPSQPPSSAKSRSQNGPSQTSSTVKSKSQDGPSQPPSSAKSRSQNGPSQTSSTVKSKSQNRPSQTTSPAKSRSKDGFSQTSLTDETLQSRSREQIRQTRLDSPLVHVSSSILSRNPDNLKLSPVYDKDVRDDKALERVLYCLRALADNSQPKEVMMVISQLQFGKYLREPTYAATAARLPRPSTLPKHFLQQKYHEGDFDVLIIHRQHGLFTLEVKSVGANFSQLKMTEQQEEDIVMKKVEEAVKQLNKAEVVLKHLTSDLADIKSISKILVLPNISSGQLLPTMNRNTSEWKNLCQCLGVHNVDDALKKCLLSDQLSDKRMPSDSNCISLKYLCLWWQQAVRVSVHQPLITSTAYETLVARFCGPATTVEVHCVTAPRLNIRVPGEAVSATGETMARLVLFPQQVELLNRSPPRLFLWGPPGTGKTIVLIIQGLSWLQLGHDVHVVSTWYGSRAVTIAIEHQLKETTKMTTASSRVQRHLFYFGKDGQVETAVRRLESLSKGRQLYVIADEATNYNETFPKFCDQLIAQVSELYLWSASVHREARPLCLEEVKLTAPLRSPPVVVREVMEAVQIKKYKQVHDYTISDVPFPTDGPAVMRIIHRHDQSGHTGDGPHDCVECGHLVASVLTELNVGRTGNSNGPPPLQYRDILVLCYDGLIDDRVDSNGQVTTLASGLVRGLRACHVPVRVVEKDDESAIRDMALGVGDLVTVTCWSNSHGLERKVVVVENMGDDRFERLDAMSRCTSQLVLIDC